MQNPVKSVMLSVMQSFLKKSPILGVLQGFEPISEKNMEKIMEKTCDFLPRVMR